MGSFFYAKNQSCLFNFFHNHSWSVRLPLLRTIINRSQSAESVRSRVRVSPQLIKRIHSDGFFFLCKKPIVLVQFLSQSLLERTAPSPSNDFYKIFFIFIHLHIPNTLKFSFVLYTTYNYA